MNNADNASNKYVGNDDDATVRGQVQVDITVGQKCHLLQRTNL